MSAGGRHLLPDQARGGGQEAQLGVQGRDIAGGEGAPPARGVHRQAQGSGGQWIQGGSQRDGGPQEHQQDTGLDISIINCSLEKYNFYFRQHQLCSDQDFDTVGVRRKPRNFKANSI